MGDWYEHWCESARKRSQALVKNEVGHRYGKLTVLAPALSTGHGARWVCKCDCGNTITTEGWKLRRGTIASCGCTWKRADVKPGQRFGRLTVLRELSNRRFECKCDCGRVTTVSKTNLTNGLVHSCGCLRNGTHTKDITGQRFGRLTVLRQVEKPIAYSPYAQWLCRCDCGKEIVAVSGNLVDGRTRSCGCLRGVLQSKDETGNRYGMLTVIGSAPSEGKGSRWACVCDCGNTVTVLGSNLRKGHHKSCGCLRSRKVTADG